jgi:glycosyltransferase involved in cell wall biosynthesis
VTVAIDVSAIPARLTGAGVYVARLVDALSRRDDVDLALVARRDDAERWRGLGTVHAVAPGPRPARLAWEQVSAPGLARSIGAAVWHGPHYTMPVRIGVPTVVTVHDLTFFDLPEVHERVTVPIFRRMIRLAARRADALVCVSDRTAARLREVIPDVRARVEVVPHGVDHERFHPSTDRDADVDALAAIGVQPPYVVHLGTIEPRKNVPGLVRAFARVREAHPELRLVLAGVPGWGTDEVDRIIGAAGVTAAVDRLGYVDDAILPALLRAADAVAYPAFDEGFGLPVLEGLACGAVVVTSAGTVMEDVADGAALLARPGDVVALAGALLRALTDDAETARLRAAGPQVAAAYTWEAAAAAHAALYADLGSAR